jgi:hypothetical protein
MLKNIIFQKIRKHIIIFNNKIYHIVKKDIENK